MSPLKLAKISATLRRSVWLVGLAEVECSLVLAGLSSLGVVDALACKELLVCSAAACLLFITTIFCPCLLSWWPWGRVTK